MTPITIGIALGSLSALSTAFAHALIKAGSDKLAVQAWIRLTGIALALPCTLWIGPPPATLWPWLIAAAAVHALYQGIVTWSYSVSDFAAAFPIARGAAPIATALLGMALLGDRFDTATLVAVGLVSFGIFALARGQSISHAGLIAACLAGIGTTAYSLIDAKGVRIAPGAVTFIAWFYLLDGISMPALHFARARRQALALLRANAGKGIAAGALSFMAFAPALLAFRFAPVGMVAALRETSILIGLIISHRLLNEHVDRNRLRGAMLITAGVGGIIWRGAI